MKQQVARLSPHQNAKVFGVLMAVGSLIFLVPIFLIGSMFGAGSAGMPMWGIFVAPLLYLIFGYIVIVIWCAIYNVLVPFVGGIEYESTPGS